MFWSGSKRPLPAFLLPGKTINVLFETRDCGGETRGKGGIRKELAGQTYRKNLKFLGKNASNSRFVRSTWFLRCSLRGTSRRHLKKQLKRQLFQRLYRRVPALRALCQPNTIENESNNQTSGSNSRGLVGSLQIARYLQCI